MSGKAPEGEWPLLPPAQQIAAVLDGTAKVSDCQGPLSSAMKHSELRRIIISACAGNTRLGRETRARSADHPRVCGEHGVS